MKIEMPSAGLRLLSLLAMSFALSMTACAGRTVKVLDAPWVSMRHAGPPESIAKLTRVGSITESYCRPSWTSGSFGLMDEVVKQAETKHGVDYIRDASITKDEGRECVQLSGQGYRL